MEFIECRVALPRFTRWVRGLILAGLEGSSLGMAVSTIIHSKQLDQFVLTNRIAPALRKEMLTNVILFTWLVPLLIAASCAAPKLVGKRLSAFERRVRFMAPLCASGFVPLVCQPALWHDTRLAFLFTTAIFSGITVASVYTSLLVWPTLRLKGPWGDVRRVTDAIYLLLGYKVRLVLATGLILTFVCTSIAQSLGTANLASTGVGSEWSTVRHMSEVGGAMAWFGLKGLRATGHASWFGALYSLLAWFSPTVTSFLILRILAISLAALPLFYWCKKSLGVLSALIISLSFLSMPLPGMLGMDSFPITCAIGCFFLSAIYLENGSVRQGLPLVVLAISVNEQVAIWYSMLGVYLLAFSSRRMVGRWLAMVSVSYFLTVALLVLPHFGIRMYAIDPPNVTSLGLGNFEATWATLLTNPAYALSRWFDTQSLEYWLTLFVPFSFLPLRSRRWLVWLAPSLLLASTISPQDLNSPWRDPAFGHFIALGLLGTVASLREIRHAPSSGNARYQAALVGWAAALVPCVLMFGSLFYRRS